VMLEDSEPTNNACLPPIGQHQTRIEEGTRQTNCYKSRTYLQ
jgi:hypothetical protein